MLLLKCRSSSSCRCIFVWVSTCRSSPMHRNCRKQHMGCFKTTFVLQCPVYFHWQQRQWEIWITSWLLEAQKVGGFFFLLVVFTVLRALPLWLVILFVTDVCITFQHIICSICSSQAPISKAPARPACNNGILLIFQWDVPAFCAHISFCGVVLGAFDGTAARPKFLC